MRTRITDLQYCPVCEGKLPRYTASTSIASCRLCGWNENNELNEPDTMEHLVFLNPVKTKRKLSLSAACDPEGRIILSRGATDHLEIKAGDRYRIGYIPGKDKIILHFFKSTDPQTTVEARIYKNKSAVFPLGKDWTEISPNFSPEFHTLRFSVEPNSGNFLLIEFDRGVRG